jgi:hypothetical protein
LGGVPVPAQNSFELDSLQDGVKLVLKGADAGILFDLLAIKGEETSFTESTARTRSVKTGRDLSCVNESGAYSCEILMAGDTGVVKMIRDEANVIAGAPRVKEAPFNDDFMTISPSDAPGKAKVKVGQVYSKTLFDSLTVMPTATQGPDLRTGAVKSGAQIQCRETPKEGTPDEKKYECELNVDLKIGTVDKVEAKPLD